MGGLPHPNENWTSSSDTLRHRLHRAFGSGRGSFETVFPVYQVNQVRGTFSHAENIVFQLLVECGVVITVMIVGWANYLMTRLGTKLEFGAHPCIGLWV